MNKRPSCEWLASDPQIVSEVLDLTSSDQSQKDFVTRFIFCFFLAVDSADTKWPPHRIYGSFGTSEFNATRLYNTDGDSGDGIAPCYTLSTTK